MTDVIDRLAVAMNVHDLDAVAGFIHENYRSEQPAHPGACPAPDLRDNLGNPGAVWRGQPVFLRRRKTGKLFPETVNILTCRAGPS